MNLPDLLGKVKIDNSQAKAALGEVKIESAAAGKSMEAGGKSALAMAGGLSAIAAAGAGTIVVIGNLVKDFSEAGTKLYDLNKQFGIGVIELQKLQYAAKQSGISAEALATSISQMEKAASKTPEKFEQLGISFGKLRTAKPDEMLDMISKGLQGITNESERSRVAQDIFGESGAKMLRMLTADYTGLKKEAESTGLMTTEMANKAKALDGAFTKLGDVTEKLKVNLGAAFASPAILKGLELMGGLIGVMSRNADKLAQGFTDAMPGIGLMVRAYNMFGSGPAAPIDAGGGSSGVQQFQTGKGFDATIKAFGKLDDAFAKLGARMERDSDKAMTDSQRAAEKLARAWMDFAEKLQRSADDANRIFTESLAKTNKSLILGMLQTSGSGGGPDPAFMPGGKGGVQIAQLGEWYNHFSDAAEVAKRNQEEATKSAHQWSLALQGVALMAGAIGGKIGATAQVMANIAESFKGFSTMDKYGKFNAIAGGVGQIGGLMGGTGGSALQGAAGGAMTGFSIGGPVGAVVGGLAGGIMGLFGGKSKAKAELADLKTQLSGLTDEAKKFGINLDAAFASKDSKVVKAAIDSVNKAMQESEKRLAGLSTAAGGLNSFVTGGGITDQASSDRAGLYASAIFGNTLKETGDVISALGAIKPALDEMAAKAKEFGYDLSEGVQNLIGMSNVLSGDNGLADQVSGLNQLMKGLSDANLMNKDLFNAMGADATAVFNRLIEGGATSNQALALMQPTLQQLYEGQKKHGWAVDESTQALLDEAEAQGIVGDEFMSTNEQMVELLKILIETVGGELPEAFRRMGDAAEEQANRAADGINRIPRDVNVDVKTHYTTDGQPPPGGGGDQGGPGFAGGTAFRDFGTGELHMLHGEEAVLTRPQVDRLVSMAVSGVSGSTVPQGSGASGGDTYILIDKEGTAREISPAEARKIQNALNAGFIKVPSRNITNGVV